MIWHISMLFFNLFYIVYFHIQCTVGYSINGVHHWYPFLYFKLLEQERGERGLTWEFSKCLCNLLASNITNIGKCCEKKTDDICLSLLVGKCILCMEKILSSTRRIGKISQLHYSIQYNTFIHVQYSTACLRNSWVNKCVCTQYRTVQQVCVYRV